MKKKKLHLVEIAEIAVVVVVLSVVLAPVVSEVSKSQALHCQSNMNQIGKALKMYLSDWEDTYPTNRLPYPFTAWLATSINLSNPDITTPTGEPVRFQFGVNWVEALYPYTERAVKDASFSMWRCPAARDRIAGSSFAAVTYSFNANMLEKNKIALRSPEKLMLCRELESMYDSVLRPLYVTADASKLPTDPFLDSVETGVTNPRYKLHNDGSNILFADGHVQEFNAIHFSSTVKWDDQEQAWYNTTKAIRITP